MADDHRTIRGAGGKGGGGGVNDARDTLKSVAYATIVDLISEGEIELMKGGESIFLDGVPLLNPDGSENFNNVLWDFRPGTAGQTPLSLQSDVETEFTVGAEFRNDTPVTRTITDPEVDEVRVTVLLQALQNVTKKGIEGTSVEYAIDVQSNGGGFVQVLDQKIDGKSSGPYERAHRFPLKGSPPWDVRLRRVTPDNSTSTLTNKTQWASYTQIVDANLQRPDSAAVVLRIDAAQFGSIPGRAYLCRRTDVRIPTNYDPATRLYTGLWDGTFKVGASDNPAWNFWTLLTNARYGLGDFLPEASVDKWLLYQIGQYCDALVPDGKGGTEPRFTCAVELQASESAYTALNNLASIFRGIIFWGAGTVAFAQDAPSVETPLVYTAANVIEGKFTYQGSDVRTRHTVALVSWRDPSNRYAATVEYVADDAGILRYGVNSVAVTAVGCTSQGQAHRVGQWLLYSERLEAETVTFAVGLDGAYVQPGRVVQISDPLRAGKRVAGRLLAATATSATLDAPVDLAAGVVYSLSVVLPDGSLYSGAVTNAAGGAQTTLTLGTAFATLPATMAIWLLSSNELQPQLFRCVSIAEGAAEQRGRYTVTAVAHNPGKYSAIEDGLTLQVPVISALLGAPASPTSVALYESFYSDGGVDFIQVVLSCGAVPGAARYEWRYTVNAENEVTATTSANSLEIRAAIEGTWSVMVVAIAPGGRRSVPTLFTDTVGGAGSTPPALTSLDGAPQADQLLLTWAQSAYSTVRIGGSIKIRFNAGAADWAGAGDLTSASGAATQILVPRMAGYYLAKAISVDNQESADAAYVDFTGVIASAGAFPLTASPAYLSALNAATDVSTDFVRVLASGGTPPYTHAWTHLSGDVLTVDFPTSGTTTFTAAGLADGDVKNAVYRDTVTDSALTPLTATIDVPITIRRRLTAGAGGGACVAVESLLPDGRLAGWLEVGDEIEIADETSLASAQATITATSTELADCVRVVTAAGARLVCSVGAPLPLKGGGCVAARLAQDCTVAVSIDGVSAWDQVRGVTPAGRRPVRKLSLGNRSFWAGEIWGRYILHHNVKVTP